VVRPGTADSVGAAMQAAYERQGIAAQVHACEVDALGARVVS
jgi:hypothetical protein